MCTNRGQSRVYRPVLLSGYRNKYVNSDICDLIRDEWGHSDSCTQAQTRTKGRKGERVKSGDHVGI